MKDSQGSRSYQVYDCEDENNYSEFDNEDPHKNPEIHLAKRRSHENAWNNQKSKGNRSGDYSK